MSVETFNEAPSDVNRTDGTSLAKEKQAIKDDLDLKAIRVLTKLPQFNSYYQRRLGEEKQLLVDELQRDCTHEKSLELRAGIRLLNKLIHMPENDRQIKWKNLNPGKKYEPED